MSSRDAFKVILAAQCALLALLAWHFRHALNPDAVAYLRLASYYADGRLDLAVSGYWGPLLSWLLALGFKLGAEPLIAARVVMGISAVVFVCGATAVYAALGVPEKSRVVGVILAALASAYWSVQFITPDLLLSGIMLLATSRMLDGRWLAGRAAAVTTGLLWGAAYLTKAVALPLGCLMIAIVAVVAWRRAAHRSELIPKLLLAVASFALIALPWVTVLSAKYGRLTFSTTPRITHTLTGPADEARYHPYALTFHQPESGRVTSWEEPSRMDYQMWSPFANAAYAWHQVAVLARNVVTIIVLLASLHCVWPLLLLAWGRARDPALRAGIAKALLLPMSLAVIYLPCYVTLTEQRFFYAALPCLFGGLMLWAENGAAGQRVRRGLVLLLATVPLLALVLVARDTTKRAGEYAAELAGRLRTAQLVGPVAGSANQPGGRTGLYVSFLLQQPWYGDEPEPTPARIAASGARLFVVNRNSRLAAALAQDAGFVNLGARLFATTAEAEAFPVMVFAHVRWNEPEF
jgi:hypothetical protein